MYLKKRAAIFSLLKILRDLDVHDSWLVVQDLDAPDQSTSRWKWFRRYISKHQGDNHGQKI